MPTPHIVGWGHTPFGKLDNIDAEQLFRDAALPAIASAGLTPDDIDGVFVGHFNGGFVRQDFSGALAAVAIPELRHVPSVRLENACATGSAAIWGALDALASGRLKRVLLVLLEGVTPSSELVESIQGHVRGQLAPYEVPRDIEFIEQLPMTTTGKVQRRVLRLHEAERKKRLMAQSKETT